VTPFGLGVVAAMEKLAVSNELKARAAGRLGISPEYLQAKARLLALRGAYRRKDKEAIGRLKNKMRDAGFRGSRSVALNELHPYPRGRTWDIRNKFLDSEEATKKRLKPKVDAARKAMMERPNRGKKAPAPPPPPTVKRERGPSMSLQLGMSRPAPSEKKRREAWAPRPGVSIAGGYY
jgi:hypothetical protein